MELILDGIKTALGLIFSFDAEVLAVTLLSLKISSAATCASLLTGIPAGVQTRVLTTATVMESGKGNFETAIALSIILLSLTFGVNYLLTLIQQRERPR